MVDESNVLGSAGDDNNDFLRALINSDLPGGDLDLGVAQVTSSKQQDDIAQHMFQVF